MNRRHVLKSLAIITAGSTVAVGCSPKDTIWEEGLNSISLSDRSTNFISQLSQLILPVKDSGYEPPESFGSFVQTMVNDCSSIEEIEKFGLGYNEYKDFCKTSLKKNIDHLEDADIQELYEMVQNESIMTPNARHFFNTIQHLSKHHFKSSEYYLLNYTEYEMVPSRFNGCAPLS